MSTDKKENKPKQISVKLTADSIPVEIELEDGKTVIKGHLQTVSGDARSAYQNESAARAQYRDGAFVGLSDTRGLQEFLIEKALVLDTAIEKPVTAWPAPVIDVLYDAARELAGLKKPLEAATGDDAGE